MSFANAARLKVTAGHASSAVKDKLIQEQEECAKLEHQIAALHANADRLKAKKKQRSPVREEKRRTSPGRYGQREYSDPYGQEAAASPSPGTTYRRAGDSGGMVSPMYRTASPVGGGACKNAVATSSFGRSNRFTEISSVSPGPGAHDPSHTGIIVLRDGAEGPESSPGGRGGRGGRRGEQKLAGGAETATVPAQRNGAPSAQDQYSADQAATLKKELRAARRQVGQIKQEMSRFQHRSSREIEALRDTLALKNKELKQVNDKLQRFLKLFTNLEDMSMSLMDACET